MTAPANSRAQAAEHALRSIELERQAVKHCSSLSNPEYVRLMQESRMEAYKAREWLEAQNNG